MKITILFLFLLCTISTKINAEITTIIYAPQDEYAEINKNNKESSELFEILMGLTAGDKTEAALKAEKNLGSQMPPTILALGNYYLAQRNFEKAVLFHRLSMLRAYIDVRASNDNSLGDVIPLLYIWIQQAISNLSKNDEKVYTDTFKIITKKIIALDKDLPRNYDIRWASLHSINAFTNDSLNYPNEEGLQKIIESVREEYIAAAKEHEIW